ncbi:hypothetical protein D1820_05930 [Phaeobacter sp. LSS9]|uniref:DUF6151 family protein n=1 Tax=unclassified Phaeobacter TaxID=2621772 RepID=UPI000E4FB7B2|nr:DUF6151 family protein [Phaeobacter sp. LSS9]AXT34550.1 hypothetical protein D1820_05930 [Phaeobacter sp. LSS9]
MADPLSFACDCGKIRGELSQEARKAGTRIVCFCADCRANEIYHNQPDPAPGPVDLFQVNPDGVRFHQGQDLLRLMRLSPKGLFRWYAGCCGTPMANTLAKPTLPFAGLRSDRFADKDALGKIRARAFVPKQGKQPRTEGAARMVMSLLSRMISARLSGRWRETPFFDVESGEPVSKPEVISKEERAALLR